MAALEQKENEVGSIFLDPGRLGTSLCPTAPLTPPRSCSPCWGLVDQEQHWLVNCALFQWCAFWKAGMFWKRSLVIIYGSCFRPVYYKYLIILYNGSSTPWLPLVYTLWLHPTSFPSEWGHWRTMLITSLMSIFLQLGLQLHLLMGISSSWESHLSPTSGGHLGFPVGKPTPFSSWVPL